MDTPLRAGELVPNFILPDRQGRQVSRSEYRGKAGLLILFLPEGDPAAGTYAARLDAAVAAWPRGQAALVIAGDAEPADLRHARLLGPAPAEVRARFLPAEARGGWLITDRYGELYAQGAAAGVADLPEPGVFSEWMEYVGMRCGG